MKKQPTINPNDFVRVESGSEDVYIPLDEEIEVYDVDKALDEINGAIVVGSTEDKVEYLDETKTDIREAIINKGVEVSEMDTFRSYAEKIDDIAGGVHNQNKTITENGRYTCDEGYTGLGKVVVDVNPLLQDKNITSNGTFTADEGYYGLDEVTVNVDTVNNQDKNISENGTYTADAGYTGLGQVVVDVQPVLETLNVSGNGTYVPSGNVDGYDEVVVDVEPVLEDKTIRVNGTYTAGAGYDGLGEVVVDVADIPAVVEPLSVSPTTSQQIITPPANVDGFNQVTVGAVNSSIDANIVSGNIKSGVSILGVSGSVVEANETTLNVSPTTSAQTFSPTGSYTGFDEVNVSAVDSSIDVNIVSGNIKSGVSILGVQGSVVELDGETTSVNPSTSQQTITPTGNHNGLTEVVVNAVDASIDSNITSGNIVEGVTILGVSGSAVELNADSLSVSPTTSAQMITPTSPYNAFNEVSVSAVTSSIDSNITAGNIKSGVSILGVNGSVVELDGETTTVTPTTSQQTITPSGVHNGLTEVVVDAVDATIDNNIQSGNIKSGVSILGVSGSVVELSGGTASVTPTTSSQVITPTSPVNGFTRIEVSAVDASIDANIQSANIISGVNILGVVGTANEGPEYYIEKTKNSNNVLVNSSSIIDFTGINDISDYCLYYAYYKNTNISGEINFGSLPQITGTQACGNAFRECVRITSVNLGSLTAINGQNPCSNMFLHCSGILSVDLSSLTTINGNGACAGMFAECTSLPSFVFASLNDVKTAGGLQYMFSQCSNLTSLSFPALDSNSFGVYNNQFNSMLDSVTGCTVHFPSNLQSVIGSWSVVQNGFGGTNTTVLFDLPATVTLVGTNSYCRNPKYDTATALAWFDTSATRATPYYTSGTTDPVVNDAIYSDASCTTQVDTIASIS